ncbi:MAG: phosphoglycerate kinase [Acidobacteriota bacterium]|nr:phosphoglycerate kinase [Acidobacteriota bacterium]
MNKKTIRDVEISGKKVFIRVDFNVPVRDSKVEDDTRVVAALPTINYAIEKGAKVILASHLGRPLKDKKKAEEKGITYDESKYSLKPVAVRLSELLHKEVLFAEDCIGEQARQKVSLMKAGDVLLLENLRFHAGEEKNDREFASKLAELAEIYVNDAFGAAHRAHASTAGITEFLQPAVAGFLMEKELDYLSKILNNPEKPFVAILGGAKVSDKIPVIESLISKGVDKILIGGAMAYTFFKAHGLTVGKSLVEDGMIPKALEIEKSAEKSGVKLILPTDHQVVDSYDPLHSRRVIPIEFTTAGLVGLDIGTETVAIFKRELEGARTIFWNGPMGMFEEKPFDEGTVSIAKAVAEATENGAVSVVGGGDSISALKQAGVADKISHVSTGGGATLEFLAGKKLPGVEALNDK